MKYFIILLLAASTFAIANNSFSDCEKGNGNVTEKTHPIGVFSSLASNLAADVHIVKSSTAKIEVKAEDNLHDNLKFNVKDGRLDISSNKCFTTTKKLQITVYTPDLNGVESNGSGDISWKDNFDAEAFSVIVSGAGDITGLINSKDLKVVISGVGDVALKGKANVQNVAVSGAGKFNGEMLKGSIAKAEVSGVGNINLSELREIDGNVSGAGNIYYKGNPTVKKTISGIGAIKGKN